MGRMDAVSKQLNNSFGTLTVSIQEGKRSGEGIDDMKKQGHRGCRQTEGAVRYGLLLLLLKRNANLSSGQPTQGM